MSISEFEARVIEWLEGNGPAFSAEIGEGLWPERRFNSRQGAALAGGGAAGRLAQKGLVHRQIRTDFRGASYLDGWTVTVSGRRALAERAGQGS